MAEKAKPKPKSKAARGASSPPRPPAAPPRAVVYKSKNGWRVRLVGSNGEKVSASEPYFSKWNAKRAAGTMFPTFELIIQDKAAVEE